jgi:hypothetical protein
MRLLLLMDNRFVYQPFWDYVNGYISEAEWQQRFDRSREGANILGDVVPIVVDLMMENAHGVWGVRVIRWWSEGMLHPACYGTL